MWKNGTCFFNLIFIMKRHIQEETCCFSQLGTSPLHFAAQGGHVETAEVLLRAGISRDARTKVDRTPLHIAAQEGRADIVSLLLRHGADVEAKDMVGFVVTKTFRQPCYADQAH